MPTYEILTDQLVNTIEHADQDHRWLFLEQTDEFRGVWQVDALAPDYFFDFEDIIGSHRLVTPVRLDSFLARARGLGYTPIFIEDPVAILDAYAHLKEEPTVELASALPNTVKGFLPWQVVGFNKLIKTDLRAGYVIWDTGTGKSAFISAAIEYHSKQGHSFDLALIVVKSHNKLETQRKLLRMIGVHTMVIDGTIDKRFDVYEEIETKLAKGERMVVITNYEKLRDDTDAFKTLVRKRDCLFFWDEMPIKLSNRNTRLYKSVKKVLYESFHSKPNPSWMRHWALTATPIENSPADVFSCCNIMWPGLLGTPKEFDITYVGGHNPFSGKPSSWKNLDMLEAKIGFLLHRVSKDDPEVAKLFPEVLTIPKLINWNPKHRAIYDALTDKAVNLLGEDANILAMIQVMQMICDAPSMVRASADNRDAFLELLSEFGDGDEGFPPISGPIGSDVARTLLSAIDPRSLTDAGHTKLKTWVDLIVNRHPESKIVTFSTWASYIFPVWSEWLDNAGVSYVVSTGTSKQKQTALDSFRDDPSIRVFLSGDAGSDSVDMPQADVCINYNYPWKWTTRKQRVGRLDRVDSGFTKIYDYDLIMPNSIDERKQAVCERKHGYHVAIFDGRASEEALSASLTREDLLYMLLGEIS